MRRSVGWIGTGVMGRSMCGHILAGSMIGVVESLLYAHKSWLDPSAVIDVIGKGAAGSWPLNNLGRRIVKGTS